MEDGEENEVKNNHKINMIFNNAPQPLAVEKKVVKLSQDKKKTLCRR